MSLSKEEQASLLRRHGVTVPEKIELSGDVEDNSHEAILKIWKDIKAYNNMLKKKLTLINDSMTKAFPLAEGNLYLFCAYTGSGKSTVAANIAYPLWRQEKKVLYISNEEPKQDVLFRIAALHLGYDFNEWKRGKMPEAHQLECMKLIPIINKFVVVKDLLWRDGLTTKLEGVQALLEWIKGKNYSCVLIDYYQLIKDSINEKGKTRFEILNDFRLWLGRYIKDSEVPVCLFVQLHSIGKRGGVKDIDHRIKECTTIIEPAALIFEIAPNYDNYTSDFIVHKDRFDRAGVKITLPLDHGRFNNHLSDQELKARTERIAKLRAEKDLEGLLRTVNVEGIEEEDDEQFSGADYIAGQKI